MREPTQSIVDRLAWWRDMTAHAIALLLILGFLGIVFVALLGFVNLTDPTVATFIGTTAGYAIGQFGRPLAFYFPASGPPADETHKES